MKDKIMGDLNDFSLVVVRCKILFKSIWEARNWGLKFKLTYIRTGEIVHWKMYFWYKCTVTGVQILELIQKPVRLGNHLQVKHIRGRNKAC